MYHWGYHNEICIVLLYICNTQYNPCCNDKLSQESEDEGDPEGGDGDQLLQENGGIEEARGPTLVEAAEAEDNFEKRAILAYKNNLDEYKALLNKRERPATSSKLAIYFAEKVQRQGHESIPENPRRIPAIIDMFKKEGILADENVVYLTQPRLATKKEVMMVHTAEYYEKLQKLTRKAGDIKSYRKDDWSGELYDGLSDSEPDKQWKGLDPDKQWKGLWVNENTLASARYAAGGVLSCVDHVHKLGGAALALVRPPCHHAHPECAGGFCFFNSISMAAKHLVMYFEFSNSFA